METKDLEVCEVMSKELVHDFILDYCQKMNWAPGKMDDLLYWVAGPHPGAGMYVGKLDGQPITGVGMFQHNDSYAFVGLYYCKEEYRGQGYAFKTWKIARESLSPGTNIGLDAQEDAVHLYEKEGFSRAWLLSFQFFSVSCALEAYDCLVLPKGVTILSCVDHAVNFGKLKLYVEDVIGFTFNHSSILEHWINLPSHTALAAVNEDENIVGFAAIRESVILGATGYRLGPLLANNGHIARALLLELARKAHPEQKFVIGISADINPESKKIADEVKGRQVGANVRMYSKYELPISKEKYFGMFAGNLVG